MSWLTGLYIGATIFGVGVTVADLFGAFSSMFGGSDGDSDDSGAEDAEGVEELEADAGDTEAVSEDVEDAEDAAEHGDRTSLVAHDLRQRGSAFLRLMTAVRSLVYFATGFGPVGWFATTQYETAGATLVWSVPVGLVVMVGTRALRRLVRRDLSSEVVATDLLMESGAVTVSIGRGQMGRVRVSIGGTYREWYARAKDPNEEFRTGTIVRVVDTGDECVFVERD